MAKNDYLQQQTSLRNGKGYSMYFALARSYLKTVLEGIIDGKVFRVNLENEKRFLSSGIRISQQLTTITQKLSKLKVAPKVNVTVQPTPVNIEAVHDRKLASTVESLSLQQEITATQLQVKLDTLVGTIADVGKQINSIKLEVPKVQTVAGAVTVLNPGEPLKLDGVIEKLQAIQDEVGKIKLEVPKQPAIKFPAMPRVMSMVEGERIATLLEEVNKKLDELPKANPSFEFPASISIDNFPPQKYPLPVTNININALRGFASTTAVTVSSVTPTPLPGTPLAYRRALVLYNNSSVTLYVGGSDVTAANGMPVAANSYSPAFDAGPKMVVYGITASSSTNVRVLELSNDNVGG